MAALVGHGRAASAIARFQYHAPHIWDSENNQVRPVGELYQMAAPAIASRTSKTDALMMQRCRQRFHASDLNVRRASLSGGRQLTNDLSLSIYSLTPILCEVEQVRANAANRRGLLRPRDCWVQKRITCETEAS